MRMEGVAFSGTVCGAMLQINFTMWERNASDEVPVLQGTALQTARKHQCISMNV